ncbi:MAG: pyrroline-5-carboxylate reductase, partial [Betaproteobacteria bacterium]|nr:pyrroline-5-carboxylate reductase [Betaproteobacteria bacterium]
MSTRLPNPQNPPHNLAFIGGGNMASAILGGLIQQGTPASSIWVVEPFDAARE